MSKAVLVTVAEATLGEVHAARRGLPLPPPIDTEGQAFHRRECFNMRCTEEEGAKFVAAKDGGHLLVNNGRAWRVIKYEVIDG